MPITMVTMMPRGLGPGVMMRARMPTTRPISRMPRRCMALLLKLERRHHRHVVRGFLPVAQVDVDAVAGDGTRQGGRGQDVVQSPAAVGGAPVVVAIAPPGI